MPLRFSANRNTSNITADVPASGSADIDTIPTADLTAVKYLIEARNAGGTAFKSLQMTGMKKTADVSDLVDSRLGDDLDIDVNFVVDGADAVLRITNNELVIVSVSVLKFSFN